METKKYKSVNEFSPYQIVWLYMTPVQGTFALKGDIEKINGYAIGRGYEKYILRHFANKEKAISFIKSFDKKLGKRYEVRICTDAQFGKSKKNGKDLIIPFTKKQQEEVYHIG
jgi:hypothetical protein